MSDLDNEEIEATRLLKKFRKKELDEMIKSTEKSIQETCKFLKDNSFIEYKEKSADEMFEELGYRRKQTILSEKYCNENEKIIEFWKDKTISSIIKWDSVCIDYEFITMEELKAINKKCQELRMDMKVKTKNEHQIIYKLLCSITFILFLPFAILEFINESIEKILDFIGNIRCKLVYKIMEFLFERGG